MLIAKKDANTGKSLGTGRRKSAVARARVGTGSGKITVNGRELAVYFPNIQDQFAITSTLDAVGVREAVDVDITCNGGGSTGQSGAAKMAVARALVGFNDENFQKLRDEGFLTRDSRMKERKKYGLRGARRGIQFSKR
ncbi:MAG: 30S ribosomal protein S9 [Pirellulaceae bacterium]